MHGLTPNDFAAVVPPCSRPSPSVFSSSSIASRRRQLRYFFWRKRPIVKNEAGELRGEKFVAGIIRVTAEGNTSCSRSDELRRRRSFTDLAVHVKNQLPVRFDRGHVIPTA